MPAVRYSGPGSLRLETVATPSVGAGEVLVQVRAAALCHTELHFIEGTSTWASRRSPWVMRLRV